MRLPAAAIVLLLAACGTPAATPRPTDARPAPTSAAATSEPAPAPSAAPVASRVPDIELTVSPGAFSIVASIPLNVSAPSADERERARHAVQRYLERLDEYRASGYDRSRLPAPGRFGEVVESALKASATPGVVRKFVLETLRVDVLAKKPWGTTAYAEVTATIVDRDVAGRAPDQREVGRLRLVGDKLFVQDAWDGAAQRWFDGPKAVDPGHVRLGVREPIAFHLRTETWVPGSPLELFGSPDATPFWGARHAYVRGLDRTSVVERTFSEVTATVERYDGSPGIVDGIATVRVDAIVSTKHVSGTETRAPYSTRVKVLFGNWSPEVVDEEVSTGVWRSGGDLALHVRDHNFA